MSIKKITCLNMSYRNLETIIKNLNMFTESYNIVKCIKQNYKRAIYLVTDKHTSEYKILKFIERTSITNEQHTIFLFFAKCNHPNFCKITKIFYEGMFLVLEMKYIDGLTLCEYLHNNTDVNYNKLLVNILSALSILHDMKIIHGDIKPTNIMIRSDHSPVIIDYDLCHWIDCEKISHRIIPRLLGTKHYISPELVQHNMISLKTDIWALGMTFYFLLLHGDILNISKINKNDTYNNILCLTKIDKLLVKYGHVFIQCIARMVIVNINLRPCADELLKILKLSMST